MERQRWEYKSVPAYWQGAMAGLPMGEMNRLGGDGWQMTTFVPFPPNGGDGPKTGSQCGWFVFKRPKN